MTEEEDVALSLRILDAHRLYVALVSARDPSTQFQLLKQATGEPEVMAPAEVLWDWLQTSRLLVLYALFTVEEIMAQNDNAAVILAGLRETSLLRESGWPTS